MIPVNYTGFIGQRFLESNFAVYMLGIVLGAVIAYFLGSLNFGVLLSKLKYRDDVRTHGSGNAGMTNMLRTYGKAAAVATFGGDALKTIIAIVISALLTGMIGAYVAGLFCVIGHNFPIYFGFKGGKGVVTAAFTVLCLDPIVFFILLVVFILVVVTTKYVSVASILCMLMYPMVLYNFTPNPFERIKVIFALVISVLIIFMHRENIVRLRQGKENKISVGKSKKKAKAEAKKNESAKISEKSEN